MNFTMSSEGTGYELDETRETRPTTTQLQQLPTVCKRCKMNHRAISFPAAVPSSDNTSLRVLCQRRGSGVNIEGHAAGI